MHFKILRKASELQTGKQNSLTFHWLWQYQRFSVTFQNIPWLFRPLKMYVFLWLLTDRGNPEYLNRNINAFKCNLKELTTKSAWVPRSAVLGMRMPGGWLHRSCDSLARSVFSSCWVLSAIFFPSRPPPRLVGFSSTDVCQCDGCLFLSFGVGAHGWVALLCQSWGHYFNLGAGCQ